MPAPRQPRALLPDEWPALRAAINEVFRPAGGDLTRDYPLLFEETNRENLRVISDDSGGKTDRGGPNAGGAATDGHDRAAPGRGDGDGAGGTAGDRQAGSRAHAVNGTGSGHGHGASDPRGPGRSPSAPRVDHRIIAHAGFVAREAVVRRRRIRIACIGGVFTAADCRGRGLGSRVLADALARARVNRDLVLCSGDRGLYRRYGLAPLPPLACVRWRQDDGSGAAPTTPVSATKDVQTRDATADDLAAIGAFYDAEDVHFVRTRDDWLRLWTTGLLLDAPAALSVVSRGGRPIAYLATQRAQTRADGSARPRRVLEIAGDRAAIIAAAPAVADELIVPAHDATTLALAAAAGWTRTDRQFLVTAEPLTDAAATIPWYGLDYV